MLASSQLEIVPFRPIRVSAISFATLLAAPASEHIDSRIDLGPTACEKSLSDNQGLSRVPERSAYTLIERPRPTFLPLATRRVRIESNLAEIEKQSPTERDGKMSTAAVNYDTVDPKDFQAVFGTTDSDRSPEDSVLPRTERHSELVKLFKLPPGEVRPVSISPLPPGVFGGTQVHRLHIEVEGYLRRAPISCG